mgnify:FL=1
MAHSPNDFKEGIVVDIKPFHMLLVGNPGHGRSVFLGRDKVQINKHYTPPTVKFTARTSTYENRLVDDVISLKEMYGVHELYKNKNTDTMVKIAFPQYSILRNFVKKHGAIIRFFDTNPITAKQKEEEGTPSGKLTGFVDEVTFDEKFQVA